MTLYTYSSSGRRCSALFLVFVVGAGLGAGCGQPSGERVIPEVRTVDAPGPPAAPSASTAERFGLEEPPSPAAPAEPPGAAQQGIEWDVPEGWAPAPGNPMRLASFQAGPGTECYLMVFPDEAGGFEANAARWYRQMGQDAPATAALAELPSVQVIGQPAPLVYAAGTYTDMGGASHPGHALLGVIAEMPGGGTLFVKMTGPEDVVREQRDAFERFCESLRVVTGPAQ